MKIHDVAQGSPEWHALRSTTYNASDAPAMLGCSPYQTRSELIKRLATGITPEVDAETQRRFDDGHRFEALARPLAVEIIGEELYPISGSEDVGLDKPLGASLDGSTITDEILWEHKSLNDELRAILPEQIVGEVFVGSVALGATLAKMYRVQMEQQLMISGAGKVLFTASKWSRDDTLVEARHCWYESDPALRAEILAGWKLLSEDIKAYMPPEVVDVKPIVSQRPENLPALHHEVTGTLVLTSNIKEWEAAARDYIKQVRDHELKTDEDFDAADQAKDWCVSTKTKLEGMKASLMSRTGEVNAAVEALDRIMGDLDGTRISFTNAIKARKEARKAEIVADGVAKFKTHIEALNARIGKPYMPAILADFGGAIKGKSSFAKMADAVTTTLAHAKLAANDAADKIERNLKWLDQNVADYVGLFADRATLVLKAPDDFVALAENRINAHKAEEQRKLDVERERIRAEEAARVEREAQQRAAAEEARIREEAATQARQQLLAEQATQQQVQAASTPVPTPAPTPAPQPQFTAVAKPITLNPVPPAANDDARMKLGDIVARIAPMSITADGLAELGFEPVSTQGNAKLFREADFPRMVKAMTERLIQAASLQAA